MTKRRSAAVSKAALATIHEGLAKAGLGGYKITSLHLTPKRRSAGAAAIEANDPCHAVQSPNGHIVIVCGD